MTWFVNPNPLPYFEIVALEHGCVHQLRLGTALAQCHDIADTMMWRLPPTGAVATGTSAQRSTPPTSTSRHALPLLHCSLARELGLGSWIC